MPRAFTDIAFTPSVKSAQTRYGSRGANQRFDLELDARNALTDHEAAFISARDSFYQATVSETGWPYVQHRGGPAGFLKVIDARTIGYADLQGNAQYISVGNLDKDDRISLILMDYPNKRRLKLLGRARTVHESEDPQLIAMLEVPTYRARVERGIVIHIEAYEWNCPQHIVPRWTQTEVDAMVAPLVAENRRLQALLALGQAASRPSDAPMSADALLGPGEEALDLVVAGVRQLTPRVRAYELRHAEGSPLPAAAPGAHLRVPVRLAEGAIVWRHYSVSASSAHHYEIAVLRDDHGKGGSKAVHEQLALGSRLRTPSPRNDFPMHSDARPAVLIAGGIGITPLRAMAQACRQEGRPWSLHYASRSRRDAAYLEELLGQQATNGVSQVRTYFDDQAERMDLALLMRQAAPDAIFYVCGPESLLAGVLQTAETLGLAPDRIKFERFKAATHQGDKPIEVVLHRARKTLQVRASQTILEAMTEAGLPGIGSCLAGQCGSCAVTVLDGEPEHRDSILTPHERTEHRQMCVCVSRARTSRLVLDI